MLSNPISGTGAAALGIAAVSALALAAVLVMQYGFGAEPCPLCIWQRYPHLALIVLGLAGYFVAPRPALLAAGLVALGSAGLALYHVGIESGFWALPSGCTVGGGATSVEELRSMLLEAPPSCDQVTFTLFGLSLALWNAILSLLLAGLAATALARGENLVVRTAT